MQLVSDGISDGVSVKFEADLLEQSVQKND